MPDPQREERQTDFEHGELFTWDAARGGFIPIERDELVERAAEVLAHEFGYPLDENEECYDAAYWLGLARRALLAVFMRTGER